MELHKLSDMIGGWFVGDFAPTVIRTPAVEVGVKAYKAGDVAKPHVHKIACEVTVIAQGRAEMNGRILEEGDIVTLAPGEPADFKCLTDVLTVVVKMPSVAGDKYDV